MGIMDRGIMQSTKNNFAEWEGGGLDPPLYIGMFVTKKKKKNLNQTLVINSPFQKSW